MSMTKKPAGFGEEDLEALLLQHDLRREWSRARDELVGIITELGFPAELGEAIARHLGSPKAIYRMTQYLYYVRPNRAELIVDEMLAIRSEIDAWKEKKAGRRASVGYNEMLYYGLEDDEDE